MSSPTLSKYHPDPPSWHQTVSPKLILPRSGEVYSYFNYIHGITEGHQKKTKKRSIENLHISNPNYLQNKANWTTSLCNIMLLYIIQYIYESKDCIYYFQGVEESSGAGPGGMYNTEHEIVQAVLLQLQEVGT